MRDYLKPSIEDEEIEIEDIMNGSPMQNRGVLDSNDFTEGEEFKSE